MSAGTVPPATRIGIAIGVIYSAHSAQAWKVIGFPQISGRSGLPIDAIRALARECPRAIEAALPQWLELSEDQEFPDAVAVRRRSVVAR